MATMEISVVPVGTGETSISDYVARAVKVARQSGMEMYISPMGTEVVGNPEDLMGLALKMHKAVFDGKSHRVLTLIRIDERDDRERPAKERVREVEEKAAR